MNPIRVADGQWHKGETLYFYNPHNAFNMPIIAGFVPVSVLYVNGKPYEFLIVDKQPEFHKSKKVSEFCNSCFLNRSNAVAYGKRALRTELQDLDSIVNSGRSKIQAKIDELE